MSRELTYEQLDRIGQLADKADNLLHALTLSVSASIHLQGCKGGLEEIRAEAQALYRELGGEAQRDAAQADLRSVVKFCIESRKQPANLQAVFLRDSILTRVDPLMTIVQLLKEEEDQTA